MKRNYPYSGPGASSQAGPSYPQPPPPAGPAPPLPAGPAPNNAQNQAYANYGYGAVPPGRYGNLAAPTAGPASDAQQAQWHQQWQQYYAQQAAAGQNRTPIAQSPQSAQAQAYGAYPQKQPSTAHQQYPQPAPPAAAPMSYGYQPSQSPPPPMQQGGYGANKTSGYYGGGPPNAQGGLAAKRPRYDQAGPARYNGGMQQQAQPYLSSAPPPGPAGAPAGPSQSYGWQGAMSGGVGPVALGMAGGPPRGGGPPNRGRGGFSGPMSSGRQSSPMSQGSPNSAQKFRGGGRGSSLPSGPSGGNRGGPDVPGWGARGGRSASGPSGPAFPGRSGPSPAAAVPAAMTGPRRSGAPGSDRGGRSGGRGGSTNSRSGFSSQNSIPINVPNGPSSRREASKKARSSSVDQSNVSMSPNTKKALTDFRIRAIEIDLLGWSWAVQDSLAHDEEDAASSASTADEEEDDRRSQSPVEPPKGPKADVKKNSLEAKSARVRAAIAATVRDSTRLRINFTVMPNVGPEGAPTGPRADKAKPPTATKGMKEPSAETTEDKVKMGEAEENAEPKDEEMKDSEQQDSAQVTEEEAKDVEIKQEAEPDTIAEAGEAPVTSTDEIPASSECTAIEDPPSDEKKSEAVEESWSPFSKNPPQSSINKVTISYAGTRRRLIIDAEAIKSLTIHRATGKIEIVVQVVTGGAIKKGQEWVICKGVLLETRQGDMQRFIALSRQQIEDVWKADEAIEMTAKEEEPKADQAEVKEEEPKADQAETKDEEGQAETKEAQGDVAKGDEEVVPKVEATATSTEDEMQVKEEEKTDQAKGTQEQATATVPESKADPTSSPSLGPRSEVPPLYRLLPSHAGPSTDLSHPASLASEMTIIAYLDKISPLVEPSWVKTGDLDAFLGSRPSDFVWSDKLHIVDPDPPPTIDTIIEEWCGESFLGSAKERRRFVAEAFQGARGLVEVVARLVRSDKGHVSPGSLREPLAEAFKKNGVGASHTLASLAVLAIFDLVPLQTQGLRAKIGEILLSFPKHALFKTLDSLWKEKIEKSRGGKRKRDQLIPR